MAESPDTYMCQSSTDCSAVNGDALAGIARLSSCSYMSSHHCGI